MCPYKQCDETCPQYAYDLKKYKEALKRANRITVALLWHDLRKKEEEAT